MAASDLQTSRSRAGAAWVNIESSSWDWPVWRSASAGTITGRAIGPVGLETRPAGDAAPVHLHLFRHARVRQIVRQTKSLPLAQKRAGWARLQPAYLSIGDEEARQMMRALLE